jgi:hypothetical protein
VSKTLSYFCEDGQVFDIERVERGIPLGPAAAPPNEGAIDWLLACPFKDFFLEVESDSTS